MIDVNAAGLQTGSARHPGRLSSSRSTVVWLVVALDIAATITAFILVPDAPDVPIWAAALLTVIVASFGLVGALVATRQPRNAVGWILGVVATALTVATFGQYYATFSLRAFEGRLPGTVALAWLARLPMVPAIVAVVVFIPLLFPDGRLLSRRWRWLVAFDAAVLAASLLPVAFQPGPLSANPAIVNPIGSAAVFGLVGPINDIAPLILLVFAFPMTVLSMVLRYRRGTTIERLQLKWFAAAAIFTGVWFAAPPIGPIPDIGWTLVLVSVSLVPIGIGVAIFRYHLYDIDRIISRTIGYAIVTLTLAVIFAGAILLLQADLAFLTGGNAVAVAASTLLVAALFQPLRRRVQRVVDRRFNRSRYDAERTVALFATRLRDDLDLETLSADVLGAVAQTVSPATVGIWIRQPEAER